MNHKHVSLISASGLLLAMSAAFAAPPTSDLKVQGKLVVPVCSVVADEDGIYDLGKISATQVKPAADTVLPEMTKTWTISCDAETYLNLLPIDNRSDSVSSVGDTGGTSFGLGLVNKTGKIGFYKVTLANASVDGTNTNMFYSQVGSASITDTNVKPKVNAYTNWRTGWSGAGVTQKSGKVFSADLTVKPTLASSKTMNGPITDDSNIDGSVTLSFAFGI